MVEKKNSSLYRVEIKNLLHDLYGGKIFSKIFCPILKSMEFLSSLVFHTVTIQVIPHYYKQGLVQ